ncbi:MAG: hypothetical protein IT437_09990 [Phycisphaerales bacterium]|nr:hypothetical protein [Phycisphaerales bacterium]
MRPTPLLLLVLAACTGPGPAPSRPAASRPAPPPARAEAPAPAPIAPPTKPPLLGTNEEPPRPPSDPLTWRPQWWIAAPARDAGVVSASAFADAPTVLEARKAAVASGRAALKPELGAEPASLTIARYTSVRLPSGAYRAYVLVTSP